MNRWTLTIDLDDTDSETTVSVTGEVDCRLHGHEGRGAPRGAKAGIGDGSRLVVSSTSPSLTRLFDVTGIGRVLMNKRR